MAKLTLAALLISVSTAFAQDHKAELFIGAVLTDVHGDLDFNPRAATAEDRYLDVFTVTVGPQVKLLYRLSKKVLVGGFGAYGTGSSGQISTQNGANTPGKASISSTHQYYGLELQWSTSRNKPFVFYSRFDAVWASTKDHVIGFDRKLGFNDSYVSDFNTTGGGIGLGIGFIVRISRMIKFNIVDISVTFMGDEFSYDKVSTYQASFISSSIIVNIFRIK